MKDRTAAHALLVTYGDAWSDPPAKQAIISLKKRGLEVAVFQNTTGASNRSEKFSSIPVHCVEHPRFLEWMPRTIRSPVRFARFGFGLRKHLRQRPPDVIIAYMFHSLACLPRWPSMNHRVVSSIVDIPVIQDSGKFDRFVVRTAWNRLHEADLVWSSDSYKAALAQRFARLETHPLVCHNCPNADYITREGTERDPWLRLELRRRGASIGLSKGCMLLRAGALGECGGIEATLEIMKRLPENFIFVMMGRPSVGYADHLRRMITTLRLQSRAFLLDRPNDVIWKLALQGADVGHLIHGPFTADHMVRLYEFNSSLSNNRLFQYMAAGLPIISYDDPRLNGIYNEVPCFKIIRTAQQATDIETSWRELGENPAVREALGRAGRYAHLNKYCWERQFEPIEESIIRFLEEDFRLSPQVGRARIARRRHLNRGLDK